MSGIETTAADRNAFHQGTMSLSELILIVIVVAVSTFTFTVLGKLCFDKFCRGWKADNQFRRSRTPCRTCRSFSEIELRTLKQALKAGTAVERPIDADNEVQIIIPEDLQEQQAVRFTKQPKKTNSQTQSRSIKNVSELSIPSVSTAAVQTGTFQRLGIRGSTSGKNLLLPFTKQLENKHLTPIHHTPPEGKPRSSCSDNDDELAPSASVARRLTMQSKSSTGGDVQEFTRKTGSRFSSGSKESPRLSNESKGSRKSQEAAMYSSFAAQNTLLRNESLDRQQQNVKIVVPSSSLHNHQAQIFRTPANALRRKDPRPFSEPNVAGRTETRRQPRLSMFSYALASDPQTEDTSNDELAERKPLLRRNRRSPPLHRRPSKIHGEPGSTTPKPFSFKPVQVEFEEEIGITGRRTQRNPSKVSEEPPVQSPPSREDDSACQMSHIRCPSCGTELTDPNVTLRQSTASGTSSRLDSSSTVVKQRRPHTGSVRRIKQIAKGRREPPEESESEQEVFLPSVPNNSLVTEPHTYVNITEDPLLIFAKPKDGINPDSTSDSIFRRVKPPDPHLFDKRKSFPFRGVAAVDSGSEVSSSQKPPTSVSSLAWDNFGVGRMTSDNEVYEDEPTRNRTSEEYYRLAVTGSEIE